MTVLYTTLATPVGDLLVTGDGESITGLTLPPPAGRSHQPPVPPARREDATLGAVREQVAAYFAGQRTDFELPLAARGTPFQQTVWAALRTIGYGQTISYGELAAWIGRPGAARAVGLANGRNPIAIIVPCHRVIGSDGSLTGFGGGLDLKRWLLAHEAAVLGTPGPDIDTLDIDPLDTGPLDTGPLGTGPLGTGPLGTGPLGTGALGSGALRSATPGTPAPGAGARRAAARSTAARAVAARAAGPRGTGIAAAAGQSTLF